MACRETSGLMHDHRWAHDRYTNCRTRWVHGWLIEIIPKVRGSAGACSYTIRNRPNGAHGEVDNKLILIERKSCPTMSSAMQQTLSIAHALRSAGGFRRPIAFAESKR